MVEAPCPKIMPDFPLNDICVRLSNVDHNQSNKWMSYLAPRLQRSSCHSCHKCFLHFIQFFQNLPLTRLPSLVLSWESWNHQPLPSVLRFHNSSLIPTMCEDLSSIRGRSFCKEWWKFCAEPSTYSWTLHNGTIFRNGWYGRYEIDMAQWLVTMGIQWWPWPSQIQDWDNSQRPVLFFVWKEEKMGTLK